MTGRIPSTTVAMGRALDLVVENGERRAFYSMQRYGWHLLTTPGAMEREAGHGRMWVVRGRIENRRRLDDDDEHSDAQGTYEDWHHRDADWVGDLEELPDDFPILLGRAVRLGYASDKFRDKGEILAYEHDFSEPGPLVHATDDGDDPKGFFISGGGFTVGPRGIED